MLRLSMLLVSLACASCASLPSSELIVGATPALQPSTGLGVGNGLARASEAPPSHSAALSSGELEPMPLEPSTGPAAPADPRAFAASAPAAEEALRTSRTTLKAGYYSAEGTDALDDGWIVNAAWTRYLSNLFAIELEAGYFDADGEDGAIEAEVWGIPLMVNGLVSIPVWVLEVYGGLGVGGIYFDAEATGGVEDDGFLLGGNAFLGASLSLADAIALGLEGKYYLTEDSDEFDEPLDAFALMLTLGFSR
jgi:hypothetical protein